ncbi:15352_t:CDS:2, partial [Acaulospora colombiana]
GDETDSRGIDVPQGLDETDSISAALASMLPPVTESVGAQLLKRMGWRPGQGVGPRLTYEQLRRRTELEGNALPSTDDPEAKRHTYAPRDVKMTIASRKDDFHGLGYTPMTGLRPEISSSTEFGQPRLSSGFGLGALNDADDDDIDVYDNGIPSGGRKLAFENIDEDDSNNINIKSGNKGPLVTPLLSGFQIVDTPAPATQKFDSPVVPDGWAPNPAKVWGLDPRESSSSAKPTTQSAIPYHDWKQGIPADERGSMLGETPLPAATKSIWDYLSTKDRERLQNFRDKMASQDTTPAQPVPIQVVEIPRVDPAVAKAALIGYQPFKDNELKQARYTSYLNAQSTSQGVDLQPLPGQSIADFNSELESFAKAAQIFKPMSAAMASRFRSSTTVEAAPQQREGLYQPTEEAYAKHKSQAEDAAVKRMEVEETPKEHAAKLGMFGAMTREQKDWAPARLLSKRFGVRPPKVNEPNISETELPQGDMTGVTSSSSLISTGANLTSSGGAIRVVAADVNSSEVEKKMPAQIGLGEDDSQGRDTLTYERPGMDIFKAIFASDEEDSDHDMEDQPSETQILQNLQAPSMTLKEDSKEGSTSITTSEPIDLATFRPTFISRANRDDKKDGDKYTDKPQKEKKKKAAVTLSFAEDDVGLTVIPSKKRKRDKDKEGQSSKKKKEKESEKIIKMDVDEDDDEMWVEKEVPSTVRNEATASNEVKQPMNQGMKSRPKAADFL